MYGPPAGPQPACAAGPTARIPGQALALKPIRVAVKFKSAACFVFK